MSSPDERQSGLASASPIWFGPIERPLFGWAHVPAGARARGAVVLCPPIGTEAYNAHGALRDLANRLADGGLLALRFDYDGTGDSAGAEDDPDRVPAWLQSVRAAVDRVAEFGLGTVTVVGLRLGATLAAIEAARRGGVDAVVLWDPCVSGRKLLREQKVLAEFTGGWKERTDGSLELPAMLLSGETVAALSSLEITDEAEALPVGKTLALLRSPERNKKLLDRLRSIGGEYEAVTGQEELVEVPPYLARTPLGTLDRIVEWVEKATETADPRPVILPPPTSAVVDRGTQGTPIKETPLSLGSADLFGIVTEPTEPTTGPTIVFSNAGVISHIGPARMWVDLSRQWADEGLRSIRFDLGGIGDSPTHEGRERNESYPPEGLDEIRDVLRTISPERPLDIVVIGTCSGAYHALEGALAEPVRGVCLLNPILNFRPPEVRETGNPGQEVDSRRLGTTTSHGWARRLPAHELLARTVDKLPSAAWWFINKVAVKVPPSRLLERLVDTGADVLVVVGTSEGGVILRGQGAALRRLVGSGRFRLELIPTLDHALFEADGRAVVVQLLTEHVLGRYRPTPHSPVAEISEISQTSATSPA